MEDFFMIRELRNKGWTVTAISKETGFDRKTISRYLNNGAAPTVTQRKSKGSKLDPYKGYLEKRISEGTTNCNVLIEEIRALGYDGKTTILRDFVRPLRAKKGAQGTVGYETVPGRQAQVDWAVNVGTCIVDGSRQTIHAFIMVMSYSRKRYIEFTADMTQETLMKCHMNAFSYFNGVPEQILYDNMKTVVTRHSVKQIRFNKKFEDFLNYYEVCPKACKPYRAQTKGKVERAVSYLRSNFLQRKNLSDNLAELNQEVIGWLDRVVHIKVNQTTQKSPNEMFEAEHKALRKWGVRPLYRTEPWEQRTVSKDCFISFRGSLYSVPHRFVGAQLKLRSRDGLLEVFDGIECVAVHKVNTGHKLMIMEDHHYQGLPGTKKEQSHHRSAGLPTLELEETIPVPEVENRPLSSYIQYEEEYSR